MTTQQPNLGKERPRLTRPLATTLALLVGFLRLIPGRWNCTPVGGASLFAGARLRSWHAYAVPLALMVATDLLLWLVHGFDLQYSPWHISRPVVYVSFLLYVVIGRWVSNTESPWRIGTAAVLGSLQFFLITNFAVWALQPFSEVQTILYSQDLSGLLGCYLAGLPFYAWTLLGDLGFTALLFGAHAWLTRTAFPSERVPLAVSAK
jgi:hypothetical protein